MAVYGFKHFYKIIIIGHANPFGDFRQSKIGGNDKLFCVFDTFFRDKFQGGHARIFLENFIQRFSRNVKMLA